MTAAERVLAHFDRISEAPDAIPRLRRFILDLAVRGKLVDQDPNDEPASELLMRITAEKARLGKADGLKRVTTQGVELNPEAVFPVPTGWTWTRLGEICSKTGSGSTPRGGKQVYQSTGVPFLRSQNVYNEGLRLDDVAYIDEKIHRAMEGTHVAPGDLLLNITGGSIGRCCTVTDSLTGANVSQHVAIIRLAMGELRAFIHRLILSPYFQSFVIGEQTGAGRGGLPKNRMDRIPVALPPLAEQHRIVAKVDELMALCDRLEAAQKERESRRDRLVSASLAGLNEPTDAPSFSENVRFHLQHLPRMITRVEHIEQTRQTVLDLAVRGLLVQRTVTERPASEILEHIARRRATLYLEGSVPKPRSLPAVGDDEKPFPIPVGWAWARLGDLCYQVSDGPHFSPQYVAAPEGVPFLSTRNVRRNGFDLSSLKYVSKTDHEDFCKRIRPEKGDIIYTKGGTTGIAKVNDLDFDFSVWVHLAVLRIEKEKLFPRFVELALNSSHCYKQSQRYTQGISNFDLGLTRMIKITIPLPPLTEQCQIVAKVEELMAVCDRLESQLETGRVAQTALLEVTLRDRMTDGEQASVMATELG